MTMTRGDSESITISVVDEDNRETLLEKGDKIYFTVKKDVGMTEKTIQKIVTDFANNVAIIDIEPVDTNNLDIGDYIYDVQLTKKTGRVITIIKPHKFTIEDEVTYE